MLAISASERIFIRKGVEANVRNDGRGRLAFRHWDMKTGLIPHASGSAQISLDGTEALVAVKVEIGEPEHETPSSGRIVCCVKTTSAAADNKSDSNRDLEVQLSDQMRKILVSSGCIDLAKYCIIPGKQCWVINIDATVLNIAGNVLDAIILASHAALSTTSIPKVQVVTGDEPGQLEIEVDDDPFSSTPIEVSNIPVCVSLFKIGQFCVVDATLEEEDCTSARISVAIDRQGKVCSLIKSGQGGISPAALIEMTKFASPVGAKLLEQLDDLILHA